MLYNDTPHIDFSFDPADGRYALSLSRKAFAYTLSCGRDELYTPSHPTSPSTSTPPSSTTHSAPSLSLMDSQSHLKYPVLDMREVQPGVLATGHWTANHPLVDAYLTALARLAPRQRPQQAPGASACLLPTAAASTVFPPHAPIDALLSSPPPPASQPHTAQNEADRLRWRAQQGGIACAYTVAQVITVQYELFPGPGSAWYAAQVPRLSEEKKQVIFALAALRVLNHPTHPAHWALWAKNVLRRTAQVVEEVLQLKPCPIVSPVGWLGLPESVWALQGLQSTFIPPPPQPEKPKTGGMTLRKRKATAAAAASNNAAEEETTLRASPRKRQRTTRAQAALAQAEVAALSSTPPSMLLDVPLSTDAANGIDAVSKATKQELLGASPTLQPLELSLAVPDTTITLPASESQDSASTTSASRTRSAASMSPNATRRSNRARRKPAQGPVTVSVSSGSAPLSALSTPATSPAPLERPEPADVARVNPQDKRPRAGSCGSSTAVSEAGEASEGTVVDLEADVSAAGVSDAKGKRKASEVGDPEAEPVENPLEAPPPPKGRKTARAKGNSRPRKRVKIDDVSHEIAAAMLAPPEAGGEENLPAAPATVSQAVPNSKKKAAGGGGARKKAAVRRA